MVHSEEIDGWQMKLNINSEKAGIYIIHVPGMKASFERKYLLIDIIKLIYSFCESSAHFYKCM